MTVSQQLPPGHQINLNALTRLFRYTSTAYKYLFFQAILEHLNSSDFSQGKIPLKSLATEMVVLGWYPLKFFHVSFGTQDQVASIIERLNFSLNEKAISNPQTRNELRKAVQVQSQSIGLSQLLDFVPYRLLTPFFSEQLRGTREARKNQLIKELAHEYFDAEKPLYRFTSNEDDDPCIELHPAWLEYFNTSANLSIVRGWVTWEWVRYLQARNPNTPNVVNKITPPAKRASLSRPTQFWKRVLGAQHEVRCIYSDQRLVPDSGFALDHFLPWSFVCHDQLWNLCPVSPSANSSKSNRLPASGYIDSFIEQQHYALTIGRDVIGGNDWTRLTEGYVLDLRLSQTELLNVDKLHKAYCSVLMPLMTLAEQSGFEANWQYRH